MKTYFYDKEVKVLKDKKSRLSYNIYIVYEIEYKGSIDIAERKVKTITKKLGRILAGGYFSEDGKPYDFDKNYTIIKIPSNTRPRAHDKFDKFIIDLIENANN